MPNRNSLVLFLKVMLKQPTSVCALTPSSRYLARAMAKGLDIDVDETVIELGPGTGALTEEIQHIIGREGRYLGIELEPRFVSLLRERFPSLLFEQNTATQTQQVHAASGAPPVKVVVSGLSISTLPAKIVDEIIENLARVLQPGTIFRMFQYVHAYYFPSAVRFRRRMSEYFSDYHCGDLIIRNLPPAFVLTWTR